MIVQRFTNDYIPNSCQKAGVKIKEPTIAPNWVHSPECVDVTKRNGRKRNTFRVAYVHGDGRVVPEIHEGPVGDLVNEQNHGDCDADHPHGSG